MPDERNDIEKAQDESATPPAKPTIDQAQTESLRTDNPGLDRSRAEIEQAQSESVQEMELGIEEEENGQEEA